MPADYFSILKASCSMYEFQNLFPLISVSDVAEIIEYYRYAELYCRYMKLQIGFNDLI